MSPYALLQGARSFAGAASIALCLAPGIATTASASTPQAVNDAVLVDLIAQGNEAGARALFKQTNPSDVDWLFFEGRVAKAAGRFDEAAEAFREVLRRAPSYRNAKRELAHTLLIAADYRAAAHHFRDLLRTEPDEEFRLGYIHFLRAIDRRRPLSLSGQVGLVTSSNVNRGSSQSEFVPGVPSAPVFDITSQAEKGYGA